MSNSSHSTGSLRWAVGTIVGCFCMLMLAWYVESLLDEQPRKEEAQKTIPSVLRDNPTPAPSEELTPPQSQSTTTAASLLTNVTNVSKTVPPPPQQIKQEDNPTLPQPSRTNFQTAEVVAEPAMTAPLAPTLKPSDAPPPLTASKPEPQARPISPAALIQSLTSRGVQVHASVSGDSMTTTLSVMGASVKRETGIQWLGDKKVREQLKAAGIRVVIIMNGQESWTFMI